MLTELDIKKRFLSLDERKQRKKLRWEEENELQRAPETDEDSGEQETKSSGPASDGGRKRGSIR